MINVHIYVWLQLYTSVKMYICLDSFVLSLCIVYVPKIVTKATLNGEHTRKTITAISKYVALFSNQTWTYKSTIHCIHSTHSKTMELEINSPTHFFTIGKIFKLLVGITCTICAMIQCIALIDDYNARDTLRKVSQKYFHGPMPTPMLVVCSDPPQWDSSVEIVTPCPKTNITMRKFYTSFKVR